MKEITQKLIGEFERVSGQPPYGSEGETSVAIFNVVISDPGEAIRRLQFLKTGAGLDAGMIAIHSVEHDGKDIHLVNGDWVGYFGKPGFMIQIRKNEDNSADAMDPIWFSDPPTDPSLIARLMREAGEAWKNFQSKD